jgi:hypothetical protein
VLKPFIAVLAITEAGTVALARDQARSADTRA